MIRFDRRCFFVRHLGDPCLQNRVENQGDVRVSCLTGNAPPQTLARYTAREECMSTLHALTRSFQAEALNFPVCEQGGSVGVAFWSWCGPCINQSCNCYLILLRNLGRP